MAPKTNHKWCETTPISPITESHLSLHPFHATTFTISHFGSTQESFHPQSSAPVVVVIQSFLIFQPYPMFHILREVDYSKQKQKKQKNHLRPFRCAIMGLSYRSTMCYPDFTTSGFVTISIFMRNKSNFFKLIKLHST